MKPARDEIITPEHLLHASASWMAVAVAGELRNSAQGLRAGVQAAQRSVVGRETIDRRAMADLQAAADRLDGRLAALLRPVADPERRIRLLPEREVAAAVSLLTDAGARLRSVVAPRAPLVTGRPGLIGVATLHLLLGVGAGPPRCLRALRVKPDSLRIEIHDGKPADVSTAGPLHAAVVGAVVEALGGRLDLRADTGPWFEVPLEL